MAFSSSSGSVGWVIPVGTPARSDQGWTRGMPPPSSRPAGGSVVPVARRVSSFLGVRSSFKVMGGDGGLRPMPVTGGVRCTSASATAVNPVQRSPQPSGDKVQQEPKGEADPAEATVAAFLRNGKPTGPAAAETVELAGLAALVSAEPTGASTSRGAAVSGGGMQTRAVHGGERIKGGMKARATLDAIATPIVQSSTFTFRSTRECIEYNLGTYDSFEYGRYGNPTARAVEEKLMALEGAEDALVSASGMNAVTTMLLALVPENGHIVVTTDCYRRTRQFVGTVLPKMGVRTTVIDPADTAGLEAIFASEGASLFFSETPTNPLIRVLDTDIVTGLCRKYGVVSVIDSTFATAHNFRALDHGADLVLHSGTKYLAGHNDVLAGALVGSSALIAPVRQLHGVLGGVLDPHAAYLLLRGLKTLGLRMEAHNRNALTLANALEGHPKIAKVHHPSLASHVDHAIAMKQFPRGFGGVLSFELAGDGDPWSRETFEATGRFVDALRLPYIGPSMGGTESLVEQVCIMGYFNQSLRERQRLGICNGLVRFACGIEDTEDLVADVLQAMEAA
ncbi:hypothetical protein I4F81_001118 [Pyropia yezoensis]|uniref:Uncharacterized protein n=1 Tax=Pyropia yezoensis TaxID=2788 RepID=A0ACC3BKR7_PYRYE|nr:hypothetical protein I4F81_001118 [Neopyropia yezoensis]|eukprot:contig_4891_g1057